MKTMKLPLVAFSLAAIGAISGSVNGATMTLDAVDSGKFYSSGAVSGNSGILAATPDWRSFLQFNLASVEEEILGATLEIWSDSRNKNGQTINLWDVTTSNLNVSSAATFADLGSGTMFGTGVHTAGTVNSFSLNVAALTSLNGAEGIWSIGIQNMNGGYAFGYTWGVDSGDHLKLVLTTADPQAQIDNRISVPEGGSSAAMLGLVLLSFCVFKRTVSTQASRIS